MNFICKNIVLHNLLIKRTVIRTLLDGTEKSVVGVTSVTKHMFAFLSQRNELVVFTMILSN
jgi:hypothetical protein